MFNNNKILVVIPARGGSKGIPRKNIRLLDNKPLISYSIEAAKSSEYIDDVVVTTDDSEIALISEKFGASVVRRSEELSSDEIPLDPVIYDAMIQKEKQAFDEYDIVITIQPTSPLLKTSTIDKAIEKVQFFYGIDKENLDEFKKNEDLFEKYFIEFENLMNIGLGIFVPAFPT